MSPIRFAEFTLDPRLPALLAGDRPVSVRREALQVLAALVRSPGLPVARNVLQEEIWPGKPAAESAAALDAALERLRVALGDFTVPPKFVAATPDDLRFIGTLGAAAELATGPRAAAPRKSRVGLAILGVFALLLAAGAAFWLSRSVRATPAAAALPTRLAEFTALRGEVATPSFSPDAFRVAFAWNGHDANGGYDLFVKARGSLALLRLTYEPAETLASAWSPDGATIAFVRRSKTDLGIERSGLFVVPAAGGDERRLAAGEFGTPPFLQPAWSPDGKRLAFAAIVRGEHVLRVFDLDSGMIATLPRVPACRETGMPAYSADGERLAFACATATGYALYETGTQSTEVREILARPGKPLGLAWHFDETGLIVADDPGGGARLWHHRASAGTLALPFGERGSSPARRGGDLVFVRARSAGPPGSDLVLAIGSE
jgi:hypothetical protein